MNEYGLEFPAGKMICFAAWIAANSELLAKFTTKKQDILTMEKQHMICSKLPLVIVWIKTAFGDL